MTGAPWRRAALAACVLATPACVRAQWTASPSGTTAPAAPSGWRFAPGVSLAYDSFGQRYAVTDDDTLDLVDEASTRVHARIEHRGRTRFELQNTFGYGQEATRNDILAMVARELARGLELRAHQELRFKGYADGSDVANPSDYWVGTTRATAAWRAGERWLARIDERFEWAWFENVDRYNYRYRLHDVGGEIERRYGVLSALRAGYAYGLRSVPDSTAIDYRRHVAIAEWRHEFGGHGFGIEQRLERRRYRDVAARSHFWDLNASIDARVELHERLRLRPEVRAAWTQYDRPDSLWSNASEESAALLVEGDAGERTILALGPRAEFRRTRAGIDRAYNQWGLSGSVTFALGSTLWLQFTDEVGVREHLAGDDLLYSDFAFNWSTLYLTWQPLPRLGFDLFASLNPENHADDLNDTTTLLLSASATYGFR